MQALPILFHADTACTVWPDFFIILTKASEPADATVYGLLWSELYIKEMQARWTVGWKCLWLISNRKYGCLSYVLFSLSISIYLFIFINVLSCYSSVHSPFRVAHNSEKNVQVNQFQRKHENRSTRKKNKKQEPHLLSVALEAKQSRSMLILEGRPPRIVGL